MRILEEIMGLSNNQEIIQFRAKLIINGVTFRELNIRNMNNILYIISVGNSYRKRLILEIEKKVEGTLILIL